MTARPGRWGTRMGFYLAAIGTAFGLGNVWRFPYVVAENGGGAFVWLYLALVFLIGMPFLIGELMLGKVTSSPVIPALGRLSAGASDPLARSDLVNRPKFLRFVGFLPLIVCVMVLAYYSVISGWVLHFLLRFMVGAFSPHGVDSLGSLRALMQNGWLQILLTSVHLLIVVVAVAREVEEGIERWVGQVMPIFMGLLVVLAVRSLSMESANEALRFFLYPDFSRLTWASLGQAIGQVCFTLSLGFGTMVTFGSYMDEKVNVAVAGFRVAILDSLTSFFAGAMIFPLVFASPIQAASPTLLFQTVPILLGQLPGGDWFGIAFFLCLYLAALGASIGLLENAVANLRQVKKMERGPATVWVAGFCFLVSFVPALSTSLFGSISIGNRSILVAWDGFLANWMLPIAALMLSQVVVRRLDPAVKRAEFADMPGASMAILYSHWRFAIRKLAPILIFIGLLLQIFA